MVLIDTYLAEVMRVQKSIAETLHLVIVDIFKIKPKS